MLIWLHFRREIALFIYVLPTQKLTFFLRSEMHKLNRDVSEHLHTLQKDSQNKIGTFPIEAEVGPHSNQVCSSWITNWKGEESVMLFSWLWTTDNTDNVLIVEGQTIHANIADTVFPLIKVQHKQRVTAHLPCALLHIRLHYFHLDVPDKLATVRMILEGVLIKQKNNFKTVMHWCTVTQMSQESVFFFMIETFSYCYNTKETVR